MNDDFKNGYLKAIEDIWERAGLISKRKNKSREGRFTELLYFIQKLESDFNNTNGNRGSLVEHLETACMGLNPADCY